MAVGIPAGAATTPRNAARSLGKVILLENGSQYIAAVFHPLLAQYPKQARANVRREAGADSGVTYLVIGF